MPNQEFDVAVVGAGVVGTAIARELTRYRLQIALIESGPDVGAGTSKANTAIWHTGYDAPPGTLEAKLMRRAYPLMAAYAAEVGIPLERTGGLLIAWSEEQLEALPAIRDNAAKNGVTDLLNLSASDLVRREPHLGPGALGGLLIPGEGIICPYTPPLAFATDAVVNGATLFRGCPLTAVQAEGRLHVLRCGDREIRSRFVVNAAGLHADEVDRLFGHDRFHVRPRKGELIVYDKAARSLLSHVLLPIPTKTTKGVLVSPTVFGNVLLGPTADDQDDKSDRGTSRAGLESLCTKGRAILPELHAHEVTATYAGLRAATESKDYLITLEQEQRYLLVGSIRSTGLSASLGIAAHVVELLAEGGLGLSPRTDLLPIRMPYLGSDREKPARNPAEIGKRPDYGCIVCHCEEVSRGELQDAVRSPVPARDLDGLRRRTRCLQGRCQGFHCLANVAALLSETSGQRIEGVLGLEEAAK